MIPNKTLPPLVHTFLNELSTGGFTGEIESSFAERIVAATDNSIYELLPNACLFPKSSEDIQLVLSLIDKAQYRTLSITAKGGATGTNGQSLTRGIVLDLSRHMNHILDFNEQARTVTVEAGVVKDQLDAFLKPYGFFFAPELSTSNRATIGGMINTDASGQGSVTYGKTHHHVLDLTTVLPGGALLRTQSVPSAEIGQKPDREKALYQALDALLLPKKTEIVSSFPRLNRSVTGYDLYHYLMDEEKNLNHLLCGSEGTLGVVVTATLKITQIPAHSALVLISYDDFLCGLRDTTRLMQAPNPPISIEILDDKVITLAQNDFIWASTAEYFNDIDIQQLKALKLIEFSHNDEHMLNQYLNEFIAYCATHPNEHRLAVRQVSGTDAVRKIYALRKRAVALLGNIRGERRTLPFVEDTAVPPEQLADFIEEFRAVLDAHQLDYGMFGHADAGVLHVRPALDLKTSTDRDLIRTISDQVFALCCKYGGVLWGEHGKGFRSEYVARFFGPIYPVLQAVKCLFDPYNQLNPGKIAAPQDHPAPVEKIDELPLRGHYDEEILPELWQEYRQVVFCNGNGACFNYDVHAPMCPSYKATRQRIHSPKGRAMLIKEWLRLQSHHIVDTGLEDEMLESFIKCLGCQSCTGECSVKVNIPSARSKFLEAYYRKKMRPLRDYLLSGSERMAPWLYRIRAIYNPLIRFSPVQYMLAKLGIVDTPLLQQHHLNRLFQQNKIQRLTTKSLSTLCSLTPEEKERTVILLPDAFTNFFDPEPLEAAIKLFHVLGITVYLAPFRVSGKPYHVFGMRQYFSYRAKKQEKFLNSLAQTNLALIGIEPAITLLYRHEYRQELKLATPTVLLIQEWLADWLAKHPPLPVNTGSKRYRLLSHCTEKTNVANAPTLWRKVFNAFDAELELVATGCCGMGGAFGHLKEQKPLSQKIYQQSWQPVIEDTADQSALLATGYSCRSQVNRFSQITVRHPVTALAELAASEQSTQPLKAEH